MKATKMKHKSESELTDYLKSHEVPIIKGPNDKLYIIDHHHLCCAAYDINLEVVYVKILEDWSDKDSNIFWNDMHKNNYVWLYDENGAEISLEKFIQLLPKNIKHLKNDPFRSIAGVLRNKGVYEKDWTPYAEFKWANHLRSHMILDDHNQNKNIQDFDEDVLNEATELIKNVQYH